MADHIEIKKSRNHKSRKLGIKKSFGFGKIETLKIEKDSQALREDLVVSHPCSTPPLSQGQFRNGSSKFVPYVKIK